LLQEPDEAQDETPTLEHPPPVNHEVSVTNIDVGGMNNGSEIIVESTADLIDTYGSEVKNHSSPRAVEHTSPTSPCSVKSADDNGEQKLSTPGAASSGYGSAVLTHTTSSDDLLVDHAASDDINAERSTVSHPNSMVVTAEVNIIDADVPIDLDSPLKPTTPYADEPAAVLTTSIDDSILDSALNAFVVATNEPDVIESSQERSTVLCGAISNPRSSEKMDDANIDVTEPSQDQASDTVRQSGTVVDDGDGDFIESSQERSTVLCGAKSNPRSSEKMDSENVDVTEPSQDQASDTVRQSGTVVDNGGGDVIESSRERSTVLCGAKSNPRSSEKMDSENVDVTEPFQDQVSDTVRQFGTVVDDGDVIESSRERSTVLCGAKSNPRSSEKMDSGNVDVIEPSQDQASDTVRQSGTVVDDGDDDDITETLNNGSHVVESIIDLPSGICNHTSSVDSSDNDAQTANEVGSMDSLPKPQSADKSSLQTPTSRSVKASYRPVSMPPEMTIIEDEKMDIISLGMTN